MGDVDELDLRDLRSVVVAADVAARDDETRQLAASLRAALARRVDEEQRTWLADITGALNEGRVVRALRLSSRPPKAGSIFPRDIASRLADSTGASLTADASTDRWAAVLDALAFAPVRRAVTPASVPANPPAELRATVERFASRLPEIASAFGVEPPAEAPRPARRRPGSARPARPPQPPGTGEPPPTDTPPTPPQATDGEAAESELQVPSPAETGGEEIAEAAEAAEAPEPAVTEAPVASDS